MEGSVLEYYNLKKGVENGTRVTGALMSGHHERRKWDFFETVLNRTKIIIKT